MNFFLEQTTATRLRLVAQKTGFSEGALVRAALDQYLTTEFTQSGNPRKSKDET